MDVLKCIALQNPPCNNTNITRWKWIASKLLTLQIPSPHFKVCSVGDARAYTLPGIISSPQQNRQIDRAPTVEQGVLSFTFVNIPLKRFSTWGVRVTPLHSLSPTLLPRVCVWGAQSPLTTHHSRDHQQQRQTCGGKLTGRGEGQLTPKWKKLAPVNTAGVLFRNRSTRKAICQN